MRRLSVRLTGCVRLRSLVPSRKCGLGGSSRLPDSIEPDSHEPGILLLTNRKPGFDNGNSIRIAIVLDGLLEVGSVHMCLIDSLSDRQLPEPDPRITTTVITARDRTRARKVLGVFGAS